MEEAEVRSREVERNRAPAPTSLSLLARVQARFEAVRCSSARCVSPGAARTVACVSSRSLPQAVRSQQQVFGSRSSEREGRWGANFALFGWHFGVADAKGGEEAHRRLKPAVVRSLAARLEGEAVGCLLARSGERWNGGVRRWWRRWAASKCSTVHRIFLGSPIPAVGAPMGHALLCLASLLP